MKKFYVVLLFLCCSTVFAQTEKSSSDKVPVKITPKKITYVQPSKPSASYQDYLKEFNSLNKISAQLWIQNPSELLTGVASQQFQTAFQNFNCNAADDFVVPANQIWKVTDVFVNGQTLNTRVTSDYNVTFYTNSATNTPGTVISTEMVFLSSGTSSPTLALATPIYLTEGT